MRWCVVLFLLLAQLAPAQTNSPDPRLLPPARADAPVALIPFPREVEWLKESVPLRGLKLVLPEKAEQLREELTPLLRPSDSPTKGKLELVFGEVAGAPDTEEAYALTVADGSIELRAPALPGLFYALQTLKQLASTPTGTVPGCRIRDWPAFALRGFMHDTGRNFQSLELLKRQIDLASRYKLNVFHWHLTDDPGFRIESKCFPQLNKPAAYLETRDPGKFYRYEEIRDLQAYAEHRFVQIIPEIDIPGHSDYFSRALGYPMQSPEGADALKKIFTEFCDEIQTRYVHIGTDEVHVKDAQLIPDIVALLKKRGRQVIGWRPGARPEPGTITQLWLWWNEWRGTEPLPGHPCIDSRPYYLNTTDPLQGMVRYFFSQPCDVPDGDAQHLGAIACAWPDVNVDDERMILRIMPVVPGLLTLAERTWRGASVDRRNWGAIAPPPGSWENTAYTLFERDLVAHGRTLVSRWPFPYVPHTDLAWQILGPVIGSAPELEEHPDMPPAQVEVNRAPLRWQGPIYGGTINLRCWRGYNGFLQNAKEATVYALGHWQSDADRDIGLWIQFGAPFASGRAENPELGQWNLTGAKVWVNGREVAPPNWTNPGKLPDRGRETPFTDEGYWYRKPTRIHLDKGINTILLKVPGTEKGAWAFTCVPVTLNLTGIVQRAPGVRALEN